MNPANGWSCVNVQSRPGVTLHCEQAWLLQPSHDGAIGWLDTAGKTPTGVGRALSAKIMCGRSRVEKVVLLPSVK